MIGLTDFCGDWALSRRIDDRLGGAGRFEGHVRFTPEGAGLRYREDGTLTLHGQKALAASREYVWRNGAGHIAVFFADGRPFHEFRPAADSPGARHLCGDDTYRVSYDFAGWPHWRARWQVTGPRKDYVMASCYSPIAGAEKGKPGSGGQ